MPPVRRNSHGGEGRGGEEDSPIGRKGDAGVFIRRPRIPKGHANTGVNSYTRYSALSENDYHGIRDEGGNVWIPV